MSEASNLDVPCDGSCVRVGRVILVGVGVKVGVLGGVEVRLGGKVSVNVGSGRVLIDSDVGVR